MTPEPAGKQKTPTWVVVLIVVVVLAGGCCLLGTVAAIAIPNYMKFNSRAKQSECKTQVKGAYVAERAYFAEKDTFSENETEVGYTPDGRSSVLLFSLSAAPIGKGPNPDALGAAIRENTSGQLGIVGKCPDCNITIGCAANIDKDPEIDVWTVSTADRTSRSGQKIPAGQPYNEFNDVTDAPGD